MAGAVMPYKDQNWFKSQKERTTFSHKKTAKFSFSLLVSDISEAHHIISPDIATVAQHEAAIKLITALQLEGNIPEGIS